MEVDIVALRAEEGLVLFEQVVCYSSVGFVTDGTVLHHRFVFKDKRPLVTGMAGKAEIV